jgi:hypothetical protein
MKKTINIEFKNQTAKTFEVLSLATDATNIVLRNHLDGNQPLFIEVGHDLLNTQLDFSQIKSFHALYFNNENWFSGASISESDAKGDFSIITQSKQILIFPSSIDFELGDVYKIRH